MSAPAADTTSSRITRAETGIARNARVTPATAGSMHALGNFCPPLCPRRLHPASSTGPLAFRTSRVYGFLFAHQRRNLTRGRPRSQTSRRRDRLLQRAPYLESATTASSTRPLCRSGGRSVPRSHPLDSRSPRFFLPVKALSRGVPGQVCRGSA